MSFDLSKFGCISVPPLTTLPRQWGYVTTTDSIATVSASGYFNDEGRLLVNDGIRAICSDGAVWLRVSTLSPTTVVVDTDTESSLTDGRIWVGDASNDATAVLMSGDATLSNTGVLTLNDDLVNYAAVEISAAELIAAYATPKELVAAGGADTIHVVERVLIQIDYGTTQFTGGGVTLVQYDNTANGAGTAATATVAAATINGWTADSAIVVAGLLGSSALSATVNKGLFLSNQTGAFADGDSDFTVHVWYKTVATA